MENSQLQWFALQVATKKEFRIAEQVVNRGFEGYVPAMPEKRFWSDRTKEVATPLFPGYVFCRLNPEERLLPVLTIPGAVRFASCGSKPVPIDDREMESIRVAASSGRMLWRYPGLAKGEQVELTSGPLAGCIGKIERVDEAAWVLVVAITLLQRSVAIEIDPAWVTLIKKSPARSVPSPTRASISVARAS